MTEALGEPERRAAARILALSRQFAQRSRDAEAALVREFQDAVREHVATLGPLTIEDDDDEQLVLMADGRFQGRVLVTTNGSSTWRDIAAAADVVDYYEPVDLFADLTAALRERYPEAEATSAASSGSVDAPLWFPGGGLPPADAPGSGSSDVPSDDAVSGERGPADLEAAAPTESASRTILRDLHDAGVYSDADYAAKLAELDQPPGG